jgi:hypothetical protein
VLDHRLLLHVCKLQCGFHWILDDEDFTAGRIIRVAELILVHSKDIHVTKRVLQLCSWLDLGGMGWV